MKKTSLLLPIILIFLFGCTIIRKDRQINVPLNQTSFSVDKTHYRNVIQKLGPPHSMSSLPEGIVFLYEDILILEKQINISLGLGLLPFEILQWFKVSIGKGNGFRDVLLLSFNHKGYLQIQSYQSRVENLGTGGALQFIYSFQQLTNTEHLEKPLAQNFWGFDLLNPIPQNLNRNQDFVLGTSGIEQLGTTSHVGQHSLEMQNKRKERRKRN